MSRSLKSFASLALLVHPAFGDGLIHRFEGDLRPYDPSLGWTQGGTCQYPCKEVLADGHFNLLWQEAGNPVGYAYYIATPSELPPETLWVEWQFRSNHAIGPLFYTCDGAFTILYRSVHEPVTMYGDAVISFEGGDFVIGLNIEEFHTYRFESVDGINSRISVDGHVFLESVGDQSNGYSLVTFSGRGGCNGDWIPNLVNEWDFVRFGTIGYGENIVGSDPPAGFVDARAHPSLDRFTIRYDSPNYAYLDEITVEATEGIAPIPIATRRLDNGPPDVVEIVLDRPIPYNATTRFTFDDGTLSPSVEFTYAPGDANGDGQADLSDFAAFQTCFGVQPLAGPCLALDADDDCAVDLLDFAEFQIHFTGSNP